MSPRKLSALLLLAACSPVLADDGFPACLAALQDQARQARVADWIVDDVVPGLQQQARVLELDAKQPEFVQTFAQYLNARVTQARIEEGRTLYRKHREFLGRLQQKYGIPGHYLVAFWGLETNFGSYLGGMPTLDSLATLACDTRRSDFFSTEFVAALQLLERERLQPGHMRGSWAGAVGHTQFMPSNYLRYAVDGDGDGRIDLWGSEQDALASGANFLNQLGWVPELRWGREVRLQPEFRFDLAGADAGKRRPLLEWSQLGVRRSDGGPLPESELQAGILVPAGAAGPAFMVYDNFDVIMRWNRSESYAVSVGYLADRIAGAGPLRQSPPVGQRPLARGDVEVLQQQLNQLGFEAGEEDGIFGSGTRAALSEFQRSRGLVADGYPDADSMEGLQEAAAKGAADEPKD
ncbi:lytic murein transglycosylase [Haliea sp. E1-2-M8]|uniref:lytic murein transglycosylase n=1 Tax=Haliea sp. E1-2-M8 TaxID=3064706 RepID=UPI002718030A|nr:lytic murein transglycosylase [Haliea sp. E1-2-M8]MDO8861064.1 lytic murein transglycosylase [Haliea sp. E1-2-M8]